MQTCDCVIKTGRMNPFRLVAILIVLVAVSLPSMAQTVVGDDAPLRFGRFEYQGL